MKYEAERVQSAMARLGRLVSPVLRFDRFNGGRMAVYGVDKVGDDVEAVNVTNSVCRDGSTRKRERAMATGIYHVTGTASTGTEREPFRVGVAAAGSREANSLTVDRLTGDGFDVVTINGTARVCSGAGWVHGTVLRYS